LKGVLEREKKKRKEEKTKHTRFCLLHTHTNTYPPLGSLVIDPAVSKTQKRKCKEEA